MEEPEKIVSQTELDDKAQKLVEEKDADSRLRVYVGPMEKALTAVLLIWAVFQVWANMFGTLGAVKLRTAHIMFLLPLAFTLYPTFKKERRRRRLMPIWDIALIAAAVEAVASTGGQFTPPIMGAVGFVMAEFMCVSYTKVMLAAAIPAFLYYLSLLYSVHLEAKRLGLSGLSKENIPQAGKVLRERGHLLIPLVVLLALMFTGYTPLFAAIMAIFVTIPVSWVRKETRMDLETIVRATVEGSRSAIGVGISCIIIGVIIGSVNMTSLGLNFGNLILRVVGDGHLFLGGLMVMIMSIILGMGVPGVAAYVIVYVVAVPVLRGVGATEMAANMFCLIYACLSNITPPVAMSSYVAAGIADSNMTKTSLIAMKLGIAGFILPFFFLNNPVLLYGSTEGVAVSETIRTFATATIGVLAIAEGLSGLPMQKYSTGVTALRLVTRVMLIAGGLLFVNPTFATDIAALVLIAAEVVLDRVVLSKMKPVAA